MNIIGDEMMDFKGTWKTRSGKTASVKGFDEENGLWVGNIEGIHKVIEWTKDTVLGEFEDDDLMERISERWSKERSGE